VLVSVLGFGSVWRRRVGKDPVDPRRFVRAAYYNTTGVMVEGRLRGRPSIVGHVRFNGLGGFNPNYPARMIGRVFECAEPCVWRDQNKVLLRTVVAAQQPDRYLLVTRAPEVSRLMVGQAGWSSDDVWVVALSEWRQEQEAMLLMGAHGWVRSEVGRYSLTPLGGCPWRAKLEIPIGEEG
jgi:hypothetical protein